MVYIKELVPNPAGKDTIGEWVKVFNNGETSVNLSGWSLKDASGKKFVFGDQTILSHQELKLPYSLTRITLNNDGDTITLWNATGEQVDELSYGQVGEEEIVSSSKITPTPTNSNQIVNNPSPLQARAFTGQSITAEDFNPLLLSLGLAIFAGILAAALTKKLLET